MKKLIVGVSLIFQVEVVIEGEVAGKDKGKAVVQNRIRKITQTSINDT